MKKLMISNNLMAMLFVLILFNINYVAYSQDVKAENGPKTKMELFSSKTGVITKFYDFTLPRLASTYTSVETRIRVLRSGTEDVYFYQIEKEGNYSSSVASIEYSDLLEVIKAIQSLKSEVEADVQNNPDYLENKFTTSDGFQVGYYVSKGKPTWYIRLEKYGSDKTLFFKSYNTIEESMLNAKNKIDEIKNK